MYPACLPTAVLWPLGGGKASEGSKPVLEHHHPLLASLAPVAWAGVWSSLPPINLGWHLADARLPVTLPPQPGPVCGPRVHQTAHRQGRTEAEGLARALGHRLQSPAAAAGAAIVTASVGRAPSSRLLLFSRLRADKRGEHENRTYFWYIVRCIGLAQIIVGKAPEISINYSYIILHPFAQYFLEYKYNYCCSFRFVFSLGGRRCSSCCPRGLALSQGGVHTPPAVGATPAPPPHPLLRPSSRATWADE